MWLPIKRCVKYHSKILNNFNPLNMLISITPVGVLLDGDENTMYFVFCKLKLIYYLGTISLSVSLSSFVIIYLLPTVNPWGIIV